MLEGNASPTRSNHSGPLNVEKIEKSMTTVADYRKRFAERSDMNKVNYIQYIPFIISVSILCSSHD